MADKPKSIVAEISAWVAFARAAGATKFVYRVTQEEAWRLAAELGVDVVSGTVVAGAIIEVRE